MTWLPWLHRSAGLSEAEVRHSNELPGQVTALVDLVRERARLAQKVVAEAMVELEKGKSK